MRNELKLLSIFLSYYSYLFLSYLREPLLWSSSQPSFSFCVSFNPLKMLPGLLLFWSFGLVCIFVVVKIKMYTKDYVTKTAEKSNYITCWRVLKQLPTTTPLSSDLLNNKEQRIFLLMSSSPWTILIMHSLQLQQSNFASHGSRFKHQLRLSHSELLCLVYNNR